METFHPPPLKREQRSDQDPFPWAWTGQTPDEDIISVEEETREETKGEREGRKKRKKGGREEEGRDEMLPR